MCDPQKPTDSLCRLNGLFIHDVDYDLIKSLPLYRYDQDLEASIFTASKLIHTFFFFSVKSLAWASTELSLAVYFGCSPEHLQEIIQTKGPESTEPFSSMIYHLEWSVIRVQQCYFSNPNCLVISGCFSQV